MNSSPPENVLVHYKHIFLLLEQEGQSAYGENSQAENNLNMFSPAEAKQILTDFKESLSIREENKSLFALETGDGLSSILGNLEQTLFGAPAYPTPESKAAHLLYFTIKNHPFCKGNKLSASYLFIMYLQRGGILFSNGRCVITYSELADLALYIAQSSPESKSTTIDLIMQKITSNSQEAAA